MSKPSLQADLTFIKVHLSFLPKAITSLEESGISLSRSLQIITDSNEKMSRVPGPKGEILKGRMEEVLTKNSGLTVLSKIGEVMDGTGAALPAGFDAADAANLAFCPIVSVDVERTFSVFKHIFADRRQSFSEENLEKSVVVNCFFSRKR